jgi:hypothetical protein
MWLDVASCCSPHNSCSVVHDFFKPKLALKNFLRLNPGMWDRIQVCGKGIWVHGKESGYVVTLVLLMAGCGWMQQVVVTLVTLAVGCSGLL